MRAVPYRIIMEDLELSPAEQNLLDHVTRHYETIEDWERADHVFSTEQFISFLLPIYMGDFEISQGRFLQLMDSIAFEQCLNENNHKYYWVIRTR